MSFVGLHGAAFARARGAPGAPTAAVVRALVTAACLSVALAETVFAADCHEQTSTVSLLSAELAFDLNAMRPGAEPRKPSALPPIQLANGDYLTQLPIDACPGWILQSALGDRRLFRFVLPGIETEMRLPSLRASAEPPITRTGAVAHFALPEMSEREWFEPPLVAAGELSAPTGYRFYSVDHRGEWSADSGESALPRLATVCFADGLDEIFLGALTGAAWLPLPLDGNGCLELPDELAATPGMLFRSPRHEASPLNAVHLQSRMLDLTVLDESLQPVHGAYAYQRRFPTAGRFSDEHGVLRLPIEVSPTVGRSITLAHPSFETLEIDLADLVERSVRLKPAVAVEGAVRLRDGKAGPGALVTLRSEGEDPVRRVTDADGSFAFGGLPAGRSWTLDARTPHASTALSIERLAEAPPPLTMTLRPGDWRLLRVRDENDQPIPSALTEPAHDDTRRRHYTTSNRGFVLAEAVAGELLAVGRWGFSSETLDLSEYGPDEVPVDVRLYSLGTMSGRVVGQRGDKVEGATVFLCRVGIEVDRPSGGALSRRDTASCQKAVTNGAGRFTVPIQADTATAHVWSEGYEPFERTFDLAEDELWIEMVPARTTLTGVLRDRDDGRAVVGARVLGFDDQGRKAAETTRGEFVVYDDGVEVLLVYRTGDYGVEARSVEPEEHVEIELSPPGRVGGLVTNSDGEPVAKAQIALIPEGLAETRDSIDGMLFYFFVAFSEADGSYEHLSAGRGEHVVRAVHNEHDDIESRVHVSSADARLDLQFGRDVKARISGQVLGLRQSEEAIVSVAVRQGSGTYSTRMQTVAGAFEFRGLSSGQYELTARAGDRVASARGPLAESERVALTLSPQLGASVSLPPSLDADHLLLVLRATSRHYGRQIGDGNGARVGPIPPGEWTVQVTNSQGVLWQGVVTLAPGQHLRLDL